MYDLEHAWTAVREDGSLAGCWGTFHGMRLRADGLASFRTEKGCPVLYAEPGKHALLPDPALFCLHEEFPACCRDIFTKTLCRNFTLPTKHHFFFSMPSLMFFTNGSSAFLQIFISKRQIRPAGPKKLLPGPGAVLPP